MEKENARGVHAGLQSIVALATEKDEGRAGLLYGLDTSSTLLSKGLPISKLGSAIVHVHGCIEGVGCACSGVKWMLCFIGVCAVVIVCVHAHVHSCVLPCL